MHCVYSKGSPEVVSCESGRPGYSFYFDLIAPLWGSCAAEGAIHRICSLVRKMGARTLIKEELVPNEEIAREFADLQTRIGKPLPQPPVAWRLTFFAAPCPETGWVSLPESSLLGYAVVVCAKLPPKVAIVRQLCPSGDLAYILESVIRTPGKVAESAKAGYELQGVTNYYVHCQKTFCTTVGPSGGSKEYSVTGAFFCQQNGITHVCRMRP